MDREDQATRLQSEVPLLRSLRMTVSHSRGEMGFSATEHVKIIVVARAPAMFFVPCGDPACRDGGHEITDEVMRALKSGKSSFEGTDACHGALGTASSPCSTSIRYRCEAGYS